MNEVAPDDRRPTTEVALGRRSSIVQDGEYRFETRAIHAGQEPDPATGALVLPIHPSAAYTRRSMDEPREFRYSRSGNPTRAALETALASLENGTHASTFGSGMAAVSAAAQLLRAGDHCLLSDDVYGNTYRLFTEILPAYEVSCSFVDLSDVDQAREALRRNTRMIWIESPTNPHLKVVDLAALAELGRARGAVTAVDNSFCSPFFQRPLDFGIDLVVESTTKYLNGHDDIMGGAVITRDAELGARIAHLQYVMGAVPSPFDCWLLLRGMRTLPLRMERHHANGLAIARWLEQHPKVRRVHHPGLESHPRHALAERQQSGHGGMLAFELRGGRAAARAVVEGTRLFALAGGLGGVESLISYPLGMSHASQVGSAICPSDGLVRLSIGIEHVDDLLADLEQALARAE